MAANQECALGGLAVPKSAVPVLPRITPGSVFRACAVAPGMVTTSRMIVFR